MWLMWLQVQLSMNSSLVRRHLWCRPQLVCSRGNRGRGSWVWLLESAADEFTFHCMPFRAVFRRNEPRHVARGLVVVSVGSGQVFLVSGVKFAWLILLVSSGRRAWSNCLRGAIILACSQLIGLCLRIHDVIPLAANKSFAVCVALVL